MHINQVINVSIPSKFEMLHISSKFLLINYKLLNKQQY